MPPSIAKLEPRSLQKASNFASLVADDLASYSRISLGASIPQFERDEIVLGELLGSGGFNNVYEVECFDLLDDGVAIRCSSRQQECRKLLTKRSSCDKLAIKFLGQQAMDDAENYCTGAADLMIETKYLSSLSAKQHPNIIRLRGTAAAGHKGFGSGVEGGYFLILDRLYDTLDQRINIWREVKRRTEKQLRPVSSNRRVPPNSKKLLHALFLKRIMAARDLSSAIRHLHTLKIVFRDLKPENVGFDINGTLKIFDFGLAKELNPSLLNAEDTYEMSGKTGSIRYMAPEVALSKPYNLSVDVYSFGILLWRILSLQEPYHGMSCDDHFNQVVGKGVRPKLDESWPMLLSNVMKYGWAQDPLMRPTMKEVHKTLRREVHIYQESFNQEKPCSTRSST